MAVAIDLAGDAHNPVTVLNDPTSDVTLSVAEGQIMSAITNTPIMKRVATKVALKALVGTAGALAYCDETEGIYKYCATCQLPDDDDLVMTTGDGGNTRWQMIQKVSRTQGDTGWINLGGAVLTKLNSTTIRITLSSVGAYGIKSIRKDLAIGTYDCVISGAAGVKFVMFGDTTGVLSFQNTVWNFGTQVPAAIVYWNGASIVAAPQTEYHGIRDAIWHAYAHKYQGLQYDSGLTFTGAVQTDNNTNPANDQCTYLWSTDGVVTDEDASSTPGIGQWAQTLGSGLTTTTAGIFNHFYFNGTNLTTLAAMADRAPFIHAGGNTLPQWENAGVLTAATSGQYVVYHFFATPMVDGWSVFSRPHNAVFANLASAQAATPSQLTWSNYAEIKHLYTAVWRCGTAFTNATHRAKLVSLQSYRLNPGTPSSGIAATDHQALSNRTAVGAHPSTSINTDTTLFNKTLSSTDTDVQTTLNTLDENTININTVTVTSSTYQILDKDTFIVVNYGGDCTLTMPPSANMQIGHPIFITSVNTGRVLLVGGAGVYINGVLNSALPYITEYRGSIYFRYQAADNWSSFSENDCLRELTATASLAYNHRRFLFSNSSSAIYTLPDVTYMKGALFYFVRTGTGSAQLKGDGSNAIEGANTYDMTLNERLTLQSNGTKWVILAKNNSMAQGPSNIPVGGMVAMMPTLHATSWQPGASGVVKDGYMRADGATVTAQNVTDGCLFPAGTVLPNMVGSFVKGATTSGTVTAASKLIASNIPQVSTSYTPTGNNSTTQTDAFSRPAEFVPNYAINNYAAGGFAATGYVVNSAVPVSAPTFVGNTATITVGTASGSQTVVPDPANVTVVWCIRVA